MTRSGSAAFLWSLVLICTLALGGATSSAWGTEAAPPPARNASPSGAAVNANTAGVQELMTLPGIGPALAGRIVEHRKQSGPFRRAEDLLAVRGVGPKLLAKIKDRLTFDAPGNPR